MARKPFLEDFIQWRLEKIRITAYMKWQNAGCPQNQDLFFWQEAEKEFQLPQALAEAMGHGYGADDIFLRNLIDNYKARHS